jgi:hypothetical protein
LEQIKKDLAELEESKSRLIAADKTVILLQCDGVSEEMKTELTNALHDRYGFVRPAFLSAPPTKRGAADRRLIVYYFKKV